jgi:hypothetical protein
MCPRPLRILKEEHERTDLVIRFCKMTFNKSFVLHKNNFVQAIDVVSGMRLAQSAPLPPDEDM